MRKRRREIKGSEEVTKIGEPREVEDLWDLMEIKKVKKVMVVEAITG